MSKECVEDEHLTDQELRREIVAIDKKRAAYYRDYTGLQWGEKDNYDLCINTTGATIKKIVPALSEMFCAIKE